MAIPIPTEVHKKRKCPLAKMRKNIKKKQSTQGKLVIQKTCIQMVQYLEEGKKLSKDKAQALVDNMHRSILYIQKNKK